MTNPIFDPAKHQDQLPAKIIVGLERISEVFRVLLWQKAKIVGLSPIQIQILIFIAYHKSEQCTVSHLAEEFNVTKPTLSDAIKALDQKKLIQKKYAVSDNRSYYIHLSRQGQNTIAQIEDFADPVKQALNQTSNTNLDNVYDTLCKLIYQLNRQGILTVQRTCYACKFYDQKENKHYCRLLEQELFAKTIRLDCPEFETKSNP